MGAPWLPAKLADEPLPRHEIYPLAGERRLPSHAETSTSSLEKNLPILGLFALLTWSGLWLYRRFPRLQDPKAALAGILLLWVMLFINNNSWLDRRAAGFDNLAHMEYVQYILEKKSLPLAHEGWEMFQPPFYYLVNALLLGLLGISPGGEAAFRLCGGFQMLVGAGQIVLVFCSLRRLFPENPRPAIVGSLIAGLLPPNIYISHFITNEALAGLLASAAIYLGLRLIDPPPDTNPRFPASLLVGLGLCLGAGMLTKVTALLAAVAILFAMTGRLWSQKEKSMAIWGRGIVIPLLSCAVVCGWHYVRVWMHYGKPLVGNWDPIAGHLWWQDPGYQTLGYYLRFGVSLFEPFQGSLNGFWDSLYATAWGDGLYSGVQTLQMRPPWNYDLMAGGYLLALLPSLTLLVGGCAMLVTFVRKPKAKWFMLVGHAFLVIFSLLYMTIQAPSFQQAKAFYGLSALIPLGVFAAFGAELLARWLGRARILLWLGLGIWAMNTYASFWGYGAAVDAWRGWVEMRRGHYREAAELFNNTLADDSLNTSAQWGAGMTLFSAGRPDEAAKLFHQVLKEQPDNPEIQLGLALCLHRMGRNKEAIESAHKTASLQPDHRVVYPFLAALLKQEGRKEEAIKAYQEALRVRPSPELYKALQELRREGNDE